MKMVEMKDTSGWEVRGIAAGDGQLRVEAINKTRGMRPAGDRYPLIATMPKNYAHDLDNAHMIAAAPALLAALEAMIDGTTLEWHSDRQKADRQAARAAIMKARGESGPPSGQV